MNGSLPFQLSCILPSRVLFLHQDDIVLVTSPTSPLSFLRTAVLSFLSPRLCLGLTGLGRSSHAVTPTRKKTHGGGQRKYLKNMV